jgi:hypothetical protein
MKMKSTLGMALAVLALSCTKSQPADPADKGTIGAVLSAGSPFGSSFKNTSPISPYAIRANQQFEILAFAVNGKDSVQMDLTFPDTLSVNVPFNDPYGTLFALQLFHRDPATNTAANYTSYYCRVPSTTITITSWDKTAGKIAGSFSGKVAPVPPNDSITVSNGTFDTKYKTYP